jgi:hypothetical protein
MLIKLDSLDSKHRDVYRPSNPPKSLFQEYYYQLKNQIIERYLFLRSESNHSSKTSTLGQPDFQVSQKTIYNHAKINAEEYTDLVQRVDLLLPIAEKHGLAVEEILTLKDAVTVEAKFDFCLRFMHGVILQLKSEYYEKLETFSLKYEDFKFYLRIGLPMIKEIISLSSITNMVREMVTLQKMSESL